MIPRPLLGRADCRVAVGGILLCACLGCAVNESGRGRPWTIQCLELRGPERMSQAVQLADTLRATHGIRPNAVVVRDESDGAARIYYGAYQRRTDPKTGKWTLPPQLRADLQLLRELVDTNGRRYFFQALPVPMPIPDVGNPSWVLTRASGRYSLQVAVFEPTDEFWEYKQAAADYCQVLRDKGYEAYYHHGPASSVVTVGAFGDDALRTDADGRTHYAPQITALQTNELLRYNLWNGGIYKVKDAEGRSVPVPSRLIEIPRGGPTH